MSQSKDVEDVLSGRADLWKDFDQKEAQFADWIKMSANQIAADEKGPITKQLEIHKVSL